VRANWLNLTAGRGAGFSPAPFLSWELRDGQALGAVRVPPASAGSPLTSTTGLTTTTALTATGVLSTSGGVSSTATLTFTAPYTAVELLVTPGQAASALAISLNGLPVGPGGVPSRKPGGPLIIDVSAATRTDANVLAVAARPTGGGAVITVVLRPQ
jgi:hypothetical protein